MENAIPEGLIWDEKSLKVQVANHEIKFDKENPKINQNNLTLTLDGKNIVVRLVSAMPLKLRIMLHLAL